MREWFAELAATLAVDMQELGTALLLAAIGVIVALIAHRIFFGILRRLAHASESQADNVVVSSLARPTKWAMVALGLVLAARETPLLESAWEKVAGFVMPALIGWIALAIMRALVKSMELKLDLQAADNLYARRRQTRLTIFSRIATFLIIFITIGLMLLSIPGVRDIGVTLMASAGLAALAVGAAAQPALKALIGGLQMALTEPIRLDDVVIVDGEWGRIEEIRTTYVVVKVWDERRLVVPMSKFLDESFQNWTRRSSELLGTVFLHLDPLAEIDPIRAEFERQVTSNPLWDGRVQVVQVTETSASSIEVRLLMSAKDAPTLFDLRCQIREGMLAWMRDNQPDAVVVRKNMPVIAAD
ncbi:mechanosensitive ion channel family protein [Alteraurantiacibacter aquimixticola]|uniref:Mechanosensitive ion channel family protein n=1 Tax=Alteraurantiacibacter aquimixticola TaxID=2489173 RepID=A0A4T3F210_9SPHN|nr:mechanosensitive ion channel family protein [Alteraurantiacibacter aquimixticola]TIX49445.1 mechanosensitive ion channel family protein [Alteraurantiacibacter aquimixticola]